MHGLQSQCTPLNRPNRVGTRRPLPVNMVNSSAFRSLMYPLIGTGVEPLLMRPPN